MGALFPGFFPAKKVAFRGGKRETVCDTGQPKSAENNHVRGGPSGKK